MSQKELRKKTNETAAAYGLDIAKLRLLELLAKLEHCRTDYKDTDERVALFIKYDEWNRRVKEYFLKTEGGKYYEFFSRWTVIEEYYPKNFRFEAIKNEEENRKGAREVWADLEKLRKGLKEKQTVLHDFEEQLISAKGDFYTFTLTRDGMLFREINGVAESYSMKVGSLRYKILLELTRANRNRGYNTKSLTEVVGAKGERVVRKTIDEIRGQIEKKFGDITGKEFIAEGMRGSGYRLGPRIKIVLQK